jgi:hypothetical protein
MVFPVDKVKQNNIRAAFDETGIIVYQAYGSPIAISAVKHQVFVSPPFKMNRMTWIKPSFFWMMYRSGWATKPCQEHILSIRISREGLEWALQHACLSHYDPQVYASMESWKRQLVASPVRIQWDPERDRHLNKLASRSIQIGLSGEAVPRYLNDWIVDIKDITGDCRKLQAMIADEQASEEEIQSLLPRERLYEVDFDIPGI